MNASRAAENVALAWSDRARRAIAEQRAMLRAPALFKPERVERVAADLARARAEVARWLA